MILLESLLPLIKLQLLMTALFLTEEFTIDDEGTKSQNTVLIENGKLKGFMFDRLNARLMKQSSTGNGRRQSYSHIPMPRMTNTYMLSGKYEHDELIKSTKKGIYATQFSGGQVDITLVNLFLVLSEAFEIINGKIGKPLKGATLIRKWT